MRIKKLKTPIRPIVKIVLVASLVTIGLVLGAIASTKSKKNMEEIKGDFVQKSVTQNTKQKEDSIINTAKKTVADTQARTGSVLGTATQFVSETVSKAADTVSSLVTQNTGEEIKKQMDKLPKKQQEELKKEICK
jgi:apolipoprotein N-acyltransferase